MKLQIESAPPQGTPEVAPARDGPGHLTLPAADATALSLLALLVFCLACFVWGAAVLGRRERLARRSDPEEGTQHEVKPVADDAPNTRAAWEREPDWWKK